VPQQQTRWVTMRAEISHLAEEIEQAIALLRRHL
jgi:hypothetical protein